MLRTLRKKKGADRDLQRTGSQNFQSLEVHGSSPGSTGKQGKDESETNPETVKKQERPASAQRRTRCEEMIEKMSKLVSTDIATDSVDAVNGLEAKEELPSVVNEVYKMAKVERNHKFMKSEMTINTLQQIPNATDDNVVKTKAVMALSYLLVDSDDMDQVQKVTEKTNAIRQLLNQLVGFVPPNQPEKGEMSEVELLQSLVNYAVADDNKRAICEEGGKDIIPAFLNSEKADVQLLATELIWNLTFVPSNRPLLHEVKIGEKDISELLNDMKKSPNDKVRQNAEGALFVLRGLKTVETITKDEVEATDGGESKDADEDSDDDDVVIRPSSAKQLSPSTTDIDSKPIIGLPGGSAPPPPPPPYVDGAGGIDPAPSPPPPPPAPASQLFRGPAVEPPKSQRLSVPVSPADTQKKGHIMLSYNWNNQEVVLKINKRLREEGYNTWIDVENMSGSILEAMAVAVQEASLILVCYCKSYQKSANCRTEGEYVFNLKKEFIPLRMQNFKAENWLGALLGSHLYVDFTDHHSNFDEKMTQLLRQIKQRNHPTLPQQTPLTETDSKDVVPDTGKKRTASIASISPNTELSRPSSSELDFPTRSSPLPPILTKEDKVREWTSDEVKNWFTTSQINRYNEAMLSRLTGHNLIQLHNLRKEAPEFFYKCLQTDFGMDLLDILKFAQELENLKL
ncbi:uncharacterized protein [Ptychodera flava]